MSNQNAIITGIYLYLWIFFSGCVPIQQELNNSRQSKPVNSTSTNKRILVYNEEELKEHCRVKDSGYSERLTQFKKDNPELIKSMEEKCVSDTKKQLKKLGAIHVPRHILNSP